MISKARLICSVIVIFFATTQQTLWAQQTEEQLANTKSGFEGQRAMGGPTSVGAQLEEDDQIKVPAFRFPAFDRFFTPWFDWKRGINERYALRLGLDYNMLYQGASASLTDTDNAASGALRLFGQWTPVGRGTRDTGTLVFKVENRHKIGTDIPPADLGFEIGYNGITGTLFTDVGSVLVDLNWQQRFNEDTTRMIVGRYDPNDIMNVLGYANPWTTFSNLSILIDPSIALPDVGMGIGASQWFNDGWSIAGSISDANGSIKEVDFFEDGSEFFKFVELSWSPTQAQRFTHNLHLTYWHVDERETAGVPQGDGISFGANWTTDNEKWMTFFRAGWSDGLAPLFNKNLTLGFIRRFHRRDLLGLGVNWGEPSVDTLRDQYTAELFYRFQFAQNLAFTPSVQLLVDPALNLNEDEIWVAGLRMRVDL